MWDFDPDEWAFFFFATVLGVFLAVAYYRPLATTWQVRARRRAGLAIWPVVCLAPILIVLMTAADPLVRGHWDYMILFLAGGVCWILGAAVLLPMIGVSFRGDAIERGNSAAAIVAAAAMLASAVCYAGANIGRGPTIWTTIGPAAMAAGGLAAAALLVRAVSPLADAVAIDRDVRSGAIFAGLLIVSALILARAAAGDFVDWHSTVADFIRSGPWVAAAMAIAIIALWFVRPRIVPGNGGAG